MTPKQVFSHLGHPVSLGSELGRGGEGAVFEVSGASEFVAKLYHSPPPTDKAQKLRYMVDGQTDALSKLAAWPKDTLRLTRDGPVQGFIMSRASGFKDIHTLYGPKSRINEFPDATWAFLIRVAANVSRAFATVHEHGHIIGDVNQGNLMVSEKGMVKLIDCDSFQVNVGGVYHYCPVGVPTFTPPELQGRTLTNEERTKDHDAFGLAVLIFHLLFMGRHPFSGTPLGPEYVPIEKAITAFKFVYGSTAQAMQIKPPPNTLLLKDVPTQVAQLFIQAFSKEGAGGYRQNKGWSRPDPKQWVDALAKSESQLVVCKANPNHLYYGHLPKCSWCELESVPGVLFFTVGYIKVNASGASIDVEAAWRKITEVSPPPGLPTVKPTPVQTSKPVLEAHRRRQSRMITKVLVTVLLLFLSFTGLLSGLVIFWGLVGVIWFDLALGRRDVEQVTRTANSNLEGAKRKWDEVQSRWEKECAVESFEGTFNRLNKAKYDYDHLNQIKGQKVQALKDNAKELQFKRFLNNHLIDNANISGVGPARIAALRSFGIESAADINRKAVERVPSFGPKLTDKLLQWRKRVESRFVFNPALAVTQQDLKRVEQEVQTLKQKLASELAGGADRLEGTRDKLMRNRELYLPHLKQAVQKYAQAECDYNTILRR